MAVGARGPEEARFAEPPPVASECELPLRVGHPNKAAPKGAADSMGVPGLSCLWILKYLRCVWDVFSCRFQHLRS